MLKQNPVQSSRIPTSVRTDTENGFQMCDSDKDDPGKTQWDLCMLAPLPHRSRATWAGIWVGSPENPKIVL
jgi:hypothetical protein